MSEPIAEIIDTLCDDPSSCRERLLHAAGMLFSERGVDGVSTRELTGAAGVNLSAIAYYFGGKEGLYKETLNQTIQDTQSLLGGAEARLSRDVADANGDRPLLAEATVRFVENMLTALLGLGPEHWPRRIIMREIDQPTAAFDELYQAVFLPLHKGFQDLVAAATGLARGQPGTVILSSALLGQCLIFHRNRPIILRQLDREAYGADGVATIVQTVARGILQALGLPAIVAQPTAV